MEVTPRTEAMKILHCGEPMEALRMPSGSPLAPGMQVGLRCPACGEVIPNVLIGLMEARADEAQEQT